MPKKSVVVFQVLYAILLSLGSKAQVKDTAQAVIKFRDLGQVSPSEPTHKTDNGAEHTFRHVIFPQWGKTIQHPSNAAKAGSNIHT